VETLVAGLVLVSVCTATLAGASVRTPTAPRVTTAKARPARVVPVSTVAPRKLLTALTPASPVARRIVRTVKALRPPRVEFPPWWSGTCDDNDYPGSFPLSSWDGLTACGPGPNRGGYDLAVEFYPGAFGVLEWECVELSMRWMYLEYGVRPYPADGSGIVSNYSPAYGGDLRQVSNDGSSVPQPGAVLAMGSAWGEGHTAVVTATRVVGGDGTIDILQQNMNAGDGTGVLAVVHDVVGPDFGIPVTGWLQAPAGYSHPIREDRAGPRYGDDWFLGKFGLVIITSQHREIESELLRLRSEAIFRGSLRNMPVVGPFAPSSDITVW
jgi:hypothetical protein